MSAGDGDGDINMANQPKPGYSKTHDKEDQEAKDGSDSDPDSDIVFLGEFPNVPSVDDEEDEENESENETEAEANPDPDPANSLPLEDLIIDTVVARSLNLDPKDTNEPETEEQGDGNTEEGNEHDSSKGDGDEGRGQEVGMPMEVNLVCDKNNSSEEGDDFILKEVTQTDGESYAVNRDEAGGTEDDDDSDDDEETWKRKQKLLKEKVKSASADQSDRGADIVEIDDDDDDDTEIWSPRYLLRDSDDDDFDNDSISTLDDDDLQEVRRDSRQDVPVPCGPISWEQFQAVATTMAGLLSNVDTRLQVLREFFPGGNTPMPENPTPKLLNRIRRAAKLCDTFLRIVEESTNLEVTNPPSQLPSSSGTSSGNENASTNPPNDTDRVVALCSYFRLLDQTRQMLQKRDHRICRSIFYVIRFRLLRILRNRMTVKKPDSEEEFDERLMLNIRIQLARLAEESAVAPGDRGPMEIMEDIRTEKFLRYWDEIRSFPASFCYDQQAVLADHQNIGPDGFRSQLKLCGLLDFILMDEQEYSRDFSDVDSSGPDIGKMEIES